ncbi:MAG: ClpX C4-type zinc finger protein [Pseudomonadota bacterium]
MLACSFCGLDARSVNALLAGPDVNICDQCIAVGVRTIAVRDALEQPELTVDELAGTGDEALLHEMAATSRLVDQNRDRLQCQVQELRRRGVDWCAIGASLGVSRQVAQERFG